MMVPSIQSHLFHDTLPAIHSLFCNHSFSIYLYSSSDTGGNYAIAFKGTIDKNVYPVTVTPSLNIEGASQDAMTDGSNTRPSFLSTTTQQLSLTVTGLTAKQSYTIYRFSSWKVTGSTATPQDFTQLSRATAIATFTATGASYTTAITANLGDQVGWHLPIIPLSVWLQIKQLTLLLFLI